MSDVVSIPSPRAGFSRVFAETSRSQVAVTAIASGADAGPSETRAGDQIVSVVAGAATPLFLTAYAPAEY